MEQDLADFYLLQSEPSKSCLLALRDIILSNSKISETRKYGMPCFVFEKKALCYLWTSKKESLPYILFVDGQLMQHPDLVQEKRARMKIYQVDPTRDLPVDTISDLLTEAIGIRQ